ncbi:MAG: hypothetical protein NVS4B8_11750 [Herpetosiphon sp.]
MFMKAGSRYRLRVDSHNLAGADPMMILTDRDGSTVLAFNDDANGTLDPQIDFSPQVDGFYFAQVKNAGDIGNQFIAYDFFFEPLGLTGGVTPTTAVPTVGTPTGVATPSTATPFGAGTATPTITLGTRTQTATPGGTSVTTTPSRTPTVCPTPSSAYPAPCPTVRSAAVPGAKGAPPFINGPAKQFVDGAFESLWQRSDRVVASGLSHRSWLWGPTGLFARMELYKQSNGGARQVQYFDKARMEITDWNRDRSNAWFVTNGLLVQELVDGRLQIGDNDWTDNAPAPINIAGDDDDPSGPTYASFSRLLAKDVDRTGQSVTATINRKGTVGTTTAQPGTDLVHFIPETGHNIPSVFWDFMQTTGPVADGTASGPIMDWVFAMGYPISEPYWATIRVGGQSRAVLVQAFQRRVLTYTPDNPVGWQVEMGNVGRHYYRWRYNEQP